MRYTVLLKNGTTGHAESDHEPEIGEIVFVQYRNENGILRECIEEVEEILEENEF